jgi:hypothetical protein
MCIGECINGQDRPHNKDGLMRAFVPAVVGTNDQFKYELYRMKEWINADGSSDYFWVSTLLSDREAEEYISNPRK